MDHLDVATWKSTLRELMGEGLLEEDTLVRISFAYLFRIKVADTYLLTQSERRVGTYQSVGGAYKMDLEEKRELRIRFHVADEDREGAEDEPSSDYRLYVPSRHLEGFFERFDEGAMRESVRNLGREFREELVDTGVLDWDAISYRCCGRHLSDLGYDEHVQTYVLRLADIAELCPSQTQLADLVRLRSFCPDRLRFATADEILRCCVNRGKDDYTSGIASHTYKILREEEANLSFQPDAGSRFTVRLK